MAIQSITVGNGFNTVYTSNGNNAITVVYLCNTTQNVVNVNVYAVPNGGLPGMHNVIYYAVPIEGTDTYIIDTEKLILGDGDTVVVEATDPLAVVVTISSMEL